LAFTEHDYDSASGEQSYTQLPDIQIQSKIAEAGLQHSTSAVVRFQVLTPETAFGFEPAQVANVLNRAPYMGSTYSSLLYGRLTQLTYQQHQHHHGFTCKSPLGGFAYDCQEMH
jgi:hypothetical protein